MGQIRDCVTKDPSTGWWIVNQGSPLEDVVINFLHWSWGVKRGGFFPGPQPVSIERRHFPLLTKRPYVVCEKTDGTRFCMVTLLFENTERVVCLVNRALKIYVVKVGVPRPSFLGTVMDGELVGDKFIIYDTVLLNGQSVLKCDLTIRLNAVNRFVSGIIKTKTDNIKVKTKQFYPLKDIVKFQKDILPKLDYKTDGFIFTPVDEPLRIGTHETMFKWKPRDLNTVDFQFKTGAQNDRWDMLIQERGKLFFETYVPKESFKELNINEDDIMECKYDGFQWIPVLKRTDKVHPNNRRTFYNTIKNINEDIQLSEFHCLFA